MSLIPWLVFCNAPSFASENELLFAGYDGESWDVWQSSNSGVKRLTLQQDAAAPEASAAGSIAYADASGSIWIRDTNGSLTAITGIPSPCGQPTWSPDGKQLVFACFRFSQRQDDGALWLADVASGKARQIYDGPGLQKSPAWSPDGKQLAFVSGFRLDATRVIEHIWLLNLASGKARNVVEGGGAAISPAWSPDGKQLAFASDRSGSLDIWLLELSSGQQKQLTRNAAYDNDPSWSPDGRVIAFESTRSGELQIWGIPAQGGSARQLVAVGNSGLKSAKSPTWRAVIEGEQ